MTAQEAIKILQLYTDEDRRQYYQPDFVKAHEMAIEALSKSPKPQKPSWEVEPYPKHMNGAKAPFCPVCGQDLLDEANDCFNFCPDCGQAIDWSDDWCFRA